MTGDESIHVFVAELNRLFLLEFAKVHRWSMPADLAVVARDLHHVVGLAFANVGVGLGLDHRQGNIGLEEQRVVGPHGS